MTVTTAWVLWLLSGMVFILSTRNPLYLLITILMFYWLGLKFEKERKGGQWIKLNLRFMLTIVGLSGLINMLFAHTGKTVLFDLPNGWPLIGGAVTLESIVYGAINGLVIGALYLLFNIFNKALSVKQITRLIPRAFHPIATMVTISLTFFPSIQQRIREIREAQLIRGNPMKKVADWLPILIPLMVSSLEDAFLLSESMTSRGFHTHSIMKYSSLYLVLLIISAFAVFAGWIFGLYDYPKLLSIGLYILAALVVIIIFVVSGRGNPSKSYKQEAWHLADKIASMSFSLALMTTLTLLFMDNGPTFSYSPYPVIAFPQLHWTGIVLSLIPGIPLLIQKND
jgi:energy-coupling factor transporter transmembrane protein EcfT